jgi:5-formyltetrahydrofolate cyclo-ligase
MDTKENVRRLMKARLAAQDPDQGRERSLIIQRKLLALPEFQRSDCVVFYVSLPGEVNTHTMIDAALAAGKRVLVPVTDFAARRIELYRIEGRSQLAPGALGILEPVRDPLRRADASEAGCVIVPGLAFDRINNRLGRGAGLYDRFLSGVPKGVPMIGLGFGFQIVDLLPVEPHDVKLDRVLSEQGEGWT